MISLRTIALADDYLGANLLLRALNAVFRFRTNEHRHRSTKHARQPDLYHQAVRTMEELTSPPKLGLPATVVVSKSVQRLVHSGTPDGMFEALEHPKARHR